MLHRLYNKFDALTAHFNLFKVETIGDAVRALFLLPDLTVTCPRAWAPQRTGILPDALPFFS